ncbi:MAG: HAD family hydrolase [Chloroflexota bacterium]
MNWLLVSDVDDTLTGDSAALERLGQVFEVKAGTLTVAYNSSRPCASIRATIESLPELPVPDYVIGALGTEIENGRTGQRLESYTRLLDEGWQREAIDTLARSMGFAPHPEEYQTPWKAVMILMGRMPIDSFWIVWQAKTCGRR